MSEINVKAEIRKVVGKKSSQLRSKGVIPGIYYAHGQESIPISLPELTLQPLFRSSATHIINLSLDDGSSHTCILRDIQFDPVSEKPIHFDLFGINADEELTIEVPIVLKGIPKGVKDGGILQHVLHRIRVSCLPKNIPDHLDIDVEQLEINRSIHVRDVTIPNVEILENEDSTVVAVVPPTVIKEAAPAEEAAVTEEPTEPELISKGKKPEEEAGEEKSE